MTDEEKALLLEIDNLHTELIEEPTRKWNGRYMQEPSGNNYCHNAERLMEKIFELYNKFEPYYLTEHEIDAIAHTCDKEVSYVKYNYDLSIKNNAAKKRHTEFIDSIFTANLHIGRDIFSVFAKIEEVKKSEK